MEEKEGDAPCVTLRVPLDNATTVVHFRKLAKQSYPSLFASSSEEEGEDENEEAEEDLDQMEEDGNEVTIHDLRQFLNFIR